MSETDVKAKPQKSYWALVRINPFIIFSVFSLLILIVILLTVIVVRFWDIPYIANDLSATLYSLRVLLERFK